MSYKLGRAYEVMAERSVGVVLYFSRDKLIRAEFYLIAGTGLSWADWSEADEISKKDRLTALVDRIYAATPPLRFDWGILECTFDARAGSSQVIASFAPTRGAL
jgi:hypothetical protein